MNISIVDDHKLISELLKFALAKYEFITSVNSYQSGEKFLAHLDILKVDVLIVDMYIPEMDGMEIISHCRKRKSKSELKILVLSTVLDANVIKQAFKCGANGFLGKEASIDELISAIKFIQTEEEKSYVGHDLKDILVHAQLFESVRFNLSTREKELLQYVCHGKTMKETAFDLGLSINTIQSYMKQLMRKMEVNRTPDLILKAIKYGLFHPEHIA